MPNINITPATTIADLITALQGTSPGPGPAPSDAVNPNLTNYPPTHFMRNVNDVVPPGTGGTSVMPLTGHVLSDPHAEVGELLSGYYRRTSAQTGGSMAAADGITPTGEPWQIVVDRYAGRNPAAPHPAGWVDPYATQQPGNGGGGGGGTGSIAWGSLTDQDKMYAIATFNRRPGTNVPAAMAAAFNGAGDWSNFKEANEFAIANFDLASYTGPLAGRL